MSKKNKSNGLSAFLASKKGQLFFHVTYSVGASIVILGALAKIIHLPMGNTMLIIGMLVEALVFLISAFDVEQMDYEENSDTAIDAYYPEKNTYATPNRVPQHQGHTSNQTNLGNQSSTPIHTESGNGMSGNTPGGGSYSGGATQSTGSNGKDKISGSGNVNGNISGTGSVNGSLNIAGDLNISEEYLKEIDNTTKKMANFAKVMSSLNEMSEKILEGCNQINTGAGEFGDLSNNMTKLNSNVAKMNDLYESQLSSIENQMGTLSYIAQSLDRIKGLYNNTVIDSDIFRAENQRMAQQLQELNRIYARLLQAMNVGTQIQPTYAPQPYTTYPTQGYNQAPQQNYPPQQQPYNGNKPEGNQL